MNTWSWIKRLRQGKATEIAPPFVTHVPDVASRKDPTETDSSSYEPPPKVQAPNALSTAPAFVPTSAADADAAVPAVWHIGDVLLGQYEVMDILGEGGMGTVYKVHHRGWNTDLAVKSPKPQIFARVSGKENFIREAETWVNLGLHPHIVSCYYVRTLGGIPRVFAEYVAGGSLADWIRRRGLYEGGHKQALERLLDIAIQFAWGLHYAHEQGLVHQDVKPANVMITSDGTAKVTDFGLAKARVMIGEGEVHGGSSGQTILVSSRGMTPAYCSPEQVAGGGLSRKTDMWSWGVSILEMFVGGVTWMLGAVAREALASHERQDPAIPPMPAEVVKLLSRCFQPRPENRPANMLEVAALMQEIYAREIGYPYQREMPRSVEMLADSLNNRALSLFDLGKVEEAKQGWSQALQADPRHLEATYNRGVILWRVGELTDDALVQQLKELEATQEVRWQVQCLLAEVHLKRGDLEASLLLLKEAAKQAREETEVQVLFRQVHSRNISTSRYFGNMVLAMSVSLSADGRLALSGYDDKTLRLWEVETGRCLRTFEGHSGEVNSVSLSADSRLALSSSSDQTVRLWEVATGHCLRTFQGHSDKVEAVSLSADSRFALSGSRDHTLRLWEVETGCCLRTLEGHADIVRSVSLSADGRLALSGSDDKTLRLWEVETGRCLRTFEGHADSVLAVSLSADSRLALSGSKDDTVRFWDTTTGGCLYVSQGHTSGVSSVSLSADGRLALSGSGDRTMRLWEVATGRCLRTFECHNTSAWSVSLSADGRLALSAGWGTELWEVPVERYLCLLRPSQIQSQVVMSQVETQAAALLLQAEHAYSENDVVKALSLVRQVRVLPGWMRSPKGLELWRKLALHSSRVDLHSGWLASTFRGHTSWVEAVSLSADGRLALSGGDRTLRLWEVATGRCLRTLEGHADFVWSVSLSADGRLALSGGDRTARLWEVATGRCLHILEGHTGITGWVYSVSLSADSHLALSGSQDKTLRLWEVEAGRCLRTFEGHSREVNSVSLSADSRLALSGSSDRTLRLWELATGHCLRTFQGHADFVRSVSLSADGRLALSGSDDKTLRLWEVETGRCLHILEGHADIVRSVSLSADSRFALSGSDDKTLRLWEVEAGRCLRTFEGHSREVNSVSLSADSRLALSGSSDQTLRLWELDWELEARDPADWDESALPYLEIFLTQHTPYAGVLPQDREPSEQEIQRALTRRGLPSWGGQDFWELIRHLQYAGYGWLRPEAVWQKLQELSDAWREPPPLPGV